MFVIVSEANIVVLLSGITCERLLHFDKRKKIVSMEIKNFCVYRGVT
jgi:hypothetical protein